MFKQWQHGKSTVKHRYQMSDIAAMTGYSIGYLYNLSSKGVFDPKSFRSVVEFIIARRNGAG